MAKLRAELAALRVTIATKDHAPDASQPEASQASADDDPDLDQLAKAADMLGKALGEAAPEVVALRTKLLDERKRKAGAKPIRTQILNLEKRMLRRSKAADAADANAKDLRAAAELAQKSLLEAEASCGALRAEVETLEMDLQALRIREVAEATKEPMRPGPQAWLSALPREVAEGPEAAADMLLVQAAGDAMDRLFKRAQAAQPPPQEQPDPTGEQWRGHGLAQPPGNDADDDMEFDDDEDGEIERLLQQAAAVPVQTDGAEDAAAQTQHRMDLKKKMLEQVRGSVKKRLKRG